MQRSRRWFVISLAPGSLLGAAGCLGFSGSSDLDVWVRNDVDRATDYEITVDDFEASGTIAGGEIDSYDGKIDADPGDTVDVSVRFGLRVDGEFIPSYSGSDSLTVGENTKSIFARLTDMGAFYGTSQDG